MKEIIAYEWYTLLLSDIRHAILCQQMTRCCSVIAIPLLLRCASHMICYASSVIFRREWHMMQHCAISLDDARAYAR